MESNPSCIYFNEFAIKLIQNLTNKINACNGYHFVEYIEIDRYIMECLFYVIEHCIIMVKKKVNILNTNSNGLSIVHQYT